MITKSNATELRHLLREAEFSVKRIIGLKENGITKRYQISYRSCTALKMEISLKPILPSVSMQYKLLIWRVVFGPVRSLFNPPCIAAKNCHIDATQKDWLVAPKHFNVHVGFLIKLQKLSDDLKSCTASDVRENSVILQRRSQLKFAQFWINAKKRQVRLNMSARSSSKQTTASVGRVFLAR